MRAALVAQHFGNAWVRIIDIALLYVLLALGLNIVVGYAGLLDLGYVAFYAVGAYMFGLLALAAAHRHLRALQGDVPDGLHTPFWLVIPLGALRRRRGFGVLLGAPTLKLRGDYLAIVTLGFGEIVRVFLNNLDAPVNITNGPKGIGRSTRSRSSAPRSAGRSTFGFDAPERHLYYFLFLAAGDLRVVICDRLERTRIGRAWMAIREDEIAAKAMGINTRNMKLLAFGMGATFGGVSGVDVRDLPGLHLAGVVRLQESMMIVAMVVLGGIGHIPGVIVGALLLAALPEVLRYVAGPLQAMTDGRLDAAILRQLLIAVAMIAIMLSRPRGLWPVPEHGRCTPGPPATGARLSRPSRSAAGDVARAAAEA